MFQTLDQALAQASQLHERGQLAEARPIYEWILARDPRHAQVLHQLGVLVAQTGEGDEGAAWIRRAIDASPAVARFHADLGLILETQGRIDQALKCYQEAVRLDPAAADWHYKLGNAWRAAARMPEAVNCYREAVRLDPTHAEAQNNLGNGLKLDGRLEEAVVCFLAVLQLKGEDFAALVNLASTLVNLDRCADATALYRRALTLQPENAKVHRALGDALFHMRRFAQALPSYLAAQRLEPDHPDSYNNLALTLAQCDQLDNAMACCRTALDRWPANGHLRGNLGLLLKDAGRISESVAELARVADQEPESNECQSNLFCTMLFDPAADAVAIRGAPARWNQLQVERHGKTIAPHENDPTPQRRLRIGYVSPDFRNHVVGRNLLPLFRNHDRSAFEIFCYSNSQDVDETTFAFRQLAHQFQVITRDNDDQTAARIRRDRIDILVDLALHTGGNRLGIFARKPAPVQATFAGYPGSTGLTAIDYRITDPYLEPPELEASGGSEKPLRLTASFWCFDPPGREPPVTELPALARGYVTFGCLNNFCKVNPGVLALWTRVLAAVPGSRLVLLAVPGNHRRQTAEMLARGGISAERLIFHTKCPREDYLRLYNQIDVGLDTFPYNGHTTSLDSFFMGVPVVTLVGQTVVGRAGLSQLTNLGLPELIARTPDEYVRIAAGLASDLPRLAALRSSLRDRMQRSPLMDAPRFARDIEALYRQMWHAWCADRSARP
jgi:protein O-GlcNAc transferase